jgi:outer membrane protein|tara:strand:- start:3596 stop:4117 length:522 start_codon:yes stop_codon:yes gene_type:complete
VKTFKNLAAILSLVLVTQGAFAQSKIGVLNAIQALFNSEAAGVIQAELEQEFSADQDRANSLTEQLTALRDEFQQNEAVMSEDEVRRMNSSAQDLNVQLQLIGERIQTAIQEKNQNFVQLMQPDLAKAVTDIVAEGGYDLILNADSAPFFSPVLDITAKVTAKLNENAQAASE